MIVYGDSITVGYGVDGEYPCTFSPDTENVLHSYASITSNRVKSELHVIAWSGRGVVRNYADKLRTIDPTVPELYNRTLANMEASGELNYWNPTEYQVWYLCYVIESG